MEVEIIRLDDFGRGITFINNKICFVENALPKEKIIINISKETNKYIEATVEKYIEISPLRKQPACPYFNVCGGCNFWHLDFTEENKYKEEKIKGLVKKFTTINPDIVKPIKYHNESNYRNKITLHGNNQTFGLYKKSSTKIIPITKCLLVNDKINFIIKELKRLNIKFSEATIKTSNDEAYSMLKLTGKIKVEEELKKLADVLIINDNLISKESKLLTTIGDKKYYESLSSFFQINKTLTKDLYDEALNIIQKEKPNKVLDLYCGTGTIGIYVGNHCKEIIGIDYNKSNIKDANINKSLNNMTNISFICDKVENKIDTFSDIDIIIVDPPRAGLDSKTKKYILKINPKIIIYISCDPVTLVRDINTLTENYQVESITPFNMFPKTFHVETLCYLSRKDNI